MRNATGDLLKILLPEDSGQDLIEYALIACLIALAVVTVLGGLGRSFASIASNGIARGVAAWPW